MQPFHGSYASQDVTFLLKPVEMPTTDVLEKERLIQSGKRHYSEMLSAEKSPDQRYMQLFHRAMADNRVKFGTHLASLARTLAARGGRETVIVSLARAGTPPGVLLLRALRHLQRPAVHYSVSIIRDRGIDEVALDYIVARHDPRDIVFVDGWTGKGAIATELGSSIAAYNRARGLNVCPELVVVSDLCGMAGLAATSEDYLIPSAILNSIVSGLVSRSVLNSDYVGPGDFHACVFYRDKQAEDLSNYFVDEVTPAMIQSLATAPLCQWDDSRRLELRRVSDHFVEAAMRKYDTPDRNRVKPGIGESTRALLRRVPDLLLVKEPDAGDVEHLMALARTNNVPVEHDPNLPYRAAVVIKTLGE